MQYKVVSCLDEWVDDALERLESEVNILCQAGWKPQGGYFYYTYRRPTLLSCLPSNGKITAKRKN